MTFMQLMREHLEVMAMRAKEERAAELQHRLTATVIENEWRTLRLKIDQWEKETAP